MKRSSSLFLFILLIITMHCSTTNKDVFIKDKESLKKNIKIAVMPFKDAPQAPGSGDAVAEAINNEIVKIVQWDTIERMQLNKILKEQTLGATGLTDSDFDKIGKLLDTDYIITGNVAEYWYGRAALIVPKTRLSFTARIIEVKTSNIIGTVRLDRETGKNAWIGCCLLGIYYIPLAIFSEQNINEDLNKSAKIIVSEIQKRLKEK